MSREDLLIRQIKAIINDEAPLVSNLANIARILFEKIRNVSWSGFYLFDQDKQLLFLGPYQGSLACTTIEINKGVCGTAVFQKKSIIVDNVHLFPGHIACSNLTNSEIVVPIIKDDIIYGVIDLDSNDLSNFDLNCQNQLEQIAKIISLLF